MAQTPSTMLELGTKAPPFALPDARDGAIVRLEALTEGKKGLLVMFVCNHCPYVVHVRDALTKLSHEAMDRGLAVVAINANSVETHPQDGPEAMKALAEKDGFRFPFVFDETQETARAYKAACTPDFFLFDARLALVYRGQMDDARPGNGKPVTGRDLRAAIDAVLAGTEIPQDQRPSVGCNIKWKRSTG